MSYWYGLDCRPYRRARVPGRAQEDVRQREVEIRKINNLPIWAIGCLIVRIHEGDRAIPKPDA